MIPTSRAGRWSSPWSPGAGGVGRRFDAGEGVRRVTHPGLPLAVGELTINPAPRAMIRGRAPRSGRCQWRVESRRHDVTISIPDGERLPEKAINARLGTVSGLSVLARIGHRDRLRERGDEREPEARCCSIRQS